MKKFISGKAVKNKELVNEYSKHTSDALGIQVSKKNNLNLNYRHSSNMPIYNRQINIAYKLDSALNSVARLSFINSQIKEKIKGIKGSIAGKISKIEGEVDSIESAELLGVNISDMTVESYANSNYERLPEGFEVDPKTGLSLKGKEAEIDQEMNVVSLPLTGKKEGRLELRRLQIVEGRESTSSDELIEFSGSYENKISNIKKEDEKLFYRGVFISSKKNRPLLNKTLTTVLLGTRSPREVNYISVKLGSLSGVSVSKVEAKINGAWTEIDLEEMISLPGRISIYTDLIVCSLVKITFEVSEYKEIERASAVKENDLDERFLSSINAISKLKEKKEVGRYFEISLKSISIGKKEKLDVGYVSHFLDIKNSNVEIKLLQDKKGKVENYLLIEYLNENKVKKIKRVPIRRLLEDGAEEVLVLKNKVGQATFLPDRSKEITVLENGDPYEGLVEFSLNLADWSVDSSELERTLAGYERLYVRLSEVDRNNSYSIKYFYSSDSNVYIDDERLIKMLPDGSVILTEADFDKLKVHLMSILRGNEKQESYILRSTLISQVGNE